MRPFSNMWGFSLEFLVLLYFGIFIWFPLHKTMILDLAIGIGDSGSEECH